MSPTMDRGSIFALALLALGACGGRSSGGATADAAEADGAVAAGAEVAAPEDVPPAPDLPSGDYPDAVGVGGACAVTACGGDLVGTWLVRDTCYTMGQPLSEMRCPRISTDSRGLSTTGHMTFNADLSYSATLTSHGTIV